jgi:hypothetical protein
VRFPHSSRRTLIRNGVSHDRKRRHIRFCRLERRKLMLARKIRVIKA